MTTVTLSLVSHTNVGKTTLARTLLRRDVGEVVDQAHVTEVNEAHVLLETPEHRLLLWDTPGFGDTARLLRRLRNESNPLGWFLHQVWDRVSDRPLWCSQEAVRNVREDADVVLYLVNATEDPDEAGYVPLEWEILAWLGKPALVLLNQTGPGDVGDMLTRWRDAAAAHAVVQGVLPLDAFTRSWTQEGALLDTVVDLLPPDKQAAMRALSSAWNDRNHAVFDASCNALAEHLLRAAADSEPLASALAGRGEKLRAMSVLADRQNTAVELLMADLVSRHELDAAEAASLAEHLDHDFDVPGLDVSPTQAAVWGGVVTGAIGGIAADVVTGGLGLGGGMLAGALLGAAGGAGLARGYQIVGIGRSPSVGWSQDFLDGLAVDALRRYLAVAHFGRGRGGYRDEEQPAGRARAVAEAVGAQQSALHDAWKGARETHDDEARQRLVATLSSLVAAAARAALASAHPESATVLESDPAQGSDG